MKTPELKPCPFCGAMLEDTLSGYWLHPDGDCFLAVADSEYGKIAIFPSDIDLWNRRVSDES